MNTQNIIYAGLALWLVFLSIAVFFLFRFLKRLVNNAKGEDIFKILENILGTQKANSQEIVKIESEIARIKDEGMGHIQRVGLVRFNPFKEIGGDHSFSLAILDGRDCGIVVTGLHTRERTRVYAKIIKSGKCEFELSEEEKKALVKAQKKSLQ